MHTPSRNIRNHAGMPAGAWPVVGIGNPAQRRRQGAGDTPAPQIGLAFRPDDRPADFPQLSGLFALFRFMGRAPGVCVPCGLQVYCPRRRRKARRFHHGSEITPRFVAEGQKPPSFLANRKGALVASPLGLAKRARRAAMVSTPVAGKRKGKGAGFAHAACAASQACTSAQRQRVICGESFTGEGNSRSFVQRQIVARLTRKCAARSVSAA